ncbi:MAG TPA: hemerythrin domain-containing protein [Mycobacteriales bacterium]|nr:hemerythrin domain-containing protein [Mycobacteriales bacterium]
MPDAIVLLKNDHKEVEKLFKQFEKLGDGAHKQRREVVDQIIEKLSVHAAIEEQFFYPAVRKEAEEVEDVVLEGLEEHHIVKWTLDELSKMSPEEERFTPKVKVLIESVRHHVEEEEGEMFPKVREAMGRKALVELGDTLEQAKVAAPTKPHPKAPDTPPGNLVAGPTAAVADKAAGAVRKRGLLRKKG